MFDAASGRQRRKRRWPKIALGVFAVLVLIAIFSPKDDDEPDDVATTGTTVTGAAPAATGAPAPTSAPRKDVYAIGDTAKTADFEVTVYGVTDPLPTEDFLFTEAKEGFRLVSVDVQIANPTSSQESFSSLIGFHLLDADNRQYDEEIATEVTPGPPEGEIPARGAIRGYVVFEVPETATGLKLRVQGSLTASGAIFDLS